MRISAGDVYADIKDENWAEILKRLPYEIVGLFFLSSNRCNPKEEVRARFADTPSKDQEEISLSLSATCVTGQ